ncbi:phosphoethanolamine transferase [uncultured Lamprocystis sp.]|uniref:phosphoethanolamine transferase n=1 Tax=uncultured Lamprocystis sp. TaxID=543132 RepID=UPI0025D9273B|nr:phosphoethanolamine transferase [uncultured Lamprocystis sp.]
MLAFGDGQKSIFSLPGLSFFLLSAGLALLLLGLFRRPWVMFLLCLPLFAILPLEIYFIQVYQSPSTVNIVASALTGDLHEALQYIGPLLVPAFLTIIALMVLCFLGVRTLRRRDCVLSFRLRRSLIVIGSLTLGVIFAKNLIKTDWNLDETLIQTGINIERTYPVGLILRIWRVYEEQRRLRDISERIAGFRFDARLKAPADGSGLNVVLVIGESLRQSSWSLGGYARETAPRLAREAGLVAYSDATAAASLTRTSVPLMISRATAVDPDRHLEEKTLLGLFSEAGYRTWWLSNQFKLGINNTTITAHAAEADEVAFFNGSELEKTPFDEVLLAPLAQTLSRPGPTYRFVILHTMGNHWDYNYRYPETFDHWQPSLRGMTDYAIGEPGIETNMINAYDNATRFTDHILAEIIALLKSAQRPGVLIFMPDHGENLFDDARRLTAHAHDTAWELRVPLVFWATESYRTQYPHIWQQVTAHRDAPVSADNLFYSVAELGQITFSGEAPALSVASSTFAPAPRRFLSIKGSVLSADNVLRQDRPATTPASSRLVDPQTLGGR